MVLIEGLGDEVTLILGSFLLIVVLLLAWLSTHTDDIPLIREVGVIVVELRQRHRNRQQQTRTEQDQDPQQQQQAPQEVEISQSSREGLLNSSDATSDGYSESGLQANDPRPQVNLSSPFEFSSVESDTSLSSSSSIFTAPFTNRHRRGQQEGGEEQEVAVNYEERIESSTATPNLETNARPISSTADPNLEANNRPNSTLSPHFESDARRLIRLAATSNLETNDPRNSSTTTPNPETNDHPINTTPFIPLGAGNTGMYIHPDLAATLIPRLAADRSTMEFTPVTAPPSYSSSRETDEEALRRRRLEYYQMGGGVSGDGGGASGSNYNVSGDGIHGDNSNRNGGAQIFENASNTVITNNVVVVDNSDDLNLRRRKNVPLTGASECDNNSSSSRVVEPESSVPSFRSESGTLHRQSTDLDAATAAGIGGGSGAAEQGSGGLAGRVLQQNDNNIVGDDTLRQRQQGSTNAEEVRTTGGGNNDDVNNATFLEGSRIRVKLKYMNETQRFVYARPDDTIGDFRRTHFESELQDNKWVRFIFNGQDLRDDARTLQACNIEDNCTMHCLVTTRVQPGGERRQGDVILDDEEESVFGAMMYPLFTVMLMIVWYFRIFYRQYFSAMSTVCLIGISFLLGLSYISSIRNVTAAAAATNAQQQQQTQRQPPSQAATGEGGGTNHPHSD